MEEKDAVIVGARCAGSTLAIGLAERGWDVLLVDRDTFPSETISTHGVYPNTLARFEQLGVMDTLRASHHVALLANRLVGLGHEVAGLFSPIDGYDRMAVIRRSALDKAIVDTALAAGAEARFGERVVDLIGSGTEEDPVSGVVMENGDRVKAKWVFGADGRGSTVARKLGIEKERVQQGEVAFLFAYWRDIPDDGYGTLEIHEREFASRTAVEDGLHLLIAIGDAELSRGTQRERRQKYGELLRRFPEMIEPDVLERAEMVTDVIVAPESLMRGFFRKPTGPGWALLGDAGHFKHPGTAQGICDAVEQAIYIAEATLGSRLGARQLRGLARRPRRRALRLVVRLGPVPPRRDVGEALEGMGDGRRRGPGPARLVQPSGGALPGHEQGEAGALVETRRAHGFAINRGSTRRVSRNIATHLGLLVRPNTRPLANSATGHHGHTDVHMGYATRRPRRATHRYHRYMGDQQLSHPSAASWLCRTDDERARMLDMSGRLRSSRLTLIGVLVVLAGIVVPSTGWALLASIVLSAAVFWILQSRASRHRRPEYLFIAAFAVGELLIAAAIVASGGPQILLVVLLTIPTLLYGAAWPRRGVAAAPARRSY